MQTTTTKRAANGRQSKEAQRNAKAQAAYLSAQHIGADPRNALLDVWTVASQSQPDTQHTVTIDLVSGFSHCDCTAGQYDRRCVHQQAIARKMSERAAQINAAADVATANAIMDEVYDLMATSNRIADAYGWNDPRLAAIDADITRYTAQAEALRNRAAQVAAVA